jgi:lipopolysaccharide transport system ATP-binding protein
MQDLGSEIGGRRHGGGSGLQNNSTDVKLRPDEFWALKDVSFELRRGECLGLIGRNGAGKTTLLKMLNGLIKPDTGHIEMRGKVGAMIALGAGFNPILTGRENIYVSGSVLGFSKTDIDKRFDKIIDFADISSFIDSPVQTYSSGMQVRLGFAVASSMDPDILLIDEVLAVGDVGFRTKCYNRIHEISKTTAIIFVSHSMSHIDRLSTTALALANGQIGYRGDKSLAIDFYNQLFKADLKKWETIEGVGINNIVVNGQSGRRIKIEGSDSINVRIDVDLATKFERVEFTISFLSHAQELISLASNRFDSNWVEGKKGNNIFEFSVDNVSLGSGIQLMSIALRDGNTNSILFWGHAGWELNVENTPFIPSPTYRKLQIT